MKLTVTTDAAKYLRESAEECARGDKDWDTFEEACRDIIEGAVYQGKPRSGKYPVFPLIRRNYGPGETMEMIGMAGSSIEALRKLNRHFKRIGGQPCDNVHFHEGGLKYPPGWYLN